MTVVQHTPQAAGDGQDPRPGANHPQQAPRLRRHCHECGAEFRTFRTDAVYCSRTCSTAATNREKRRGVEILRMAMTWRRGRGRGHVTLSDVTAMLDRYVAEDRERERNFGGLVEAPAGLVRTVLHKGRVVGTAERVGAEWFWRPAAPGAKRDTTRRHRHSPEGCVPLRFREGRRVTFQTEG